MTTRIRVTTDFDCTNTGVTGHFKPSKLPFRDHADQLIENEDDWIRSRNQQRNWETLFQLVGLYTQPQEISAISIVDQKWQFEFDIEFDDIFNVNDDPLGLLKSICQGVPMFIKQKDQYKIVTIDYGANIEFGVINNK